MNATPKSAAPRRPMPAVYPYLILLMGTLSDYAVRPGLTHINELAVVAAVALGVALAVFLPLWLVYRNQHKAGLATFLCLLLFFFHSKLYSWLAGWPVVGSERAVLLLTLLLMAGAVVGVARVRRPLRNVTLLLNVIALGALLYPLARLGWVHGERWMARDAVARALDEFPQPVATRAPQPLPDIYYLIFDRYGSPAVLAEQYGVDNGPFYAELAGRGFLLAPESHSNYVRTSFSLASSLNLFYLDPLAEALGPDSQDWNPLHDMLTDHIAGRFLQQQGYTFIHSGSWWWATRHNPYADENINTAAALPLPFLRLLVDFTVLKPVGDELDIEAFDLRYQQWRREMWKFDRLAEVAGRPEPTFVFAHFILPHEPFVLERDGSYLPEEVMDRRSHEQNYRTQVLATNDRILALVDRILADSAVPPIILLQADEGPAHEGLRRHGLRYDWRTATGADLFTKTGILNAYHLPGAPPELIYPSISPVNSFRVVLSHYFGAELPLLEDRIYAHEQDRYPYRLFEVTELVRRHARAVKESGDAAAR